MASTTTLSKPLRIIAALVGGPVVFIGTWLLIGLVVLPIKTGNLPTRSLGFIVAAIPVATTGIFLWTLGIIDHDQLLSRKGLKPLAIIVFALATIALLVMAYFGAKESTYRQCLTNNAAIDCEIYKP